MPLSEYIPRILITDMMTDEEGQLELWKPGTGADAKKQAAQSCNPFLQREALT